MKRAVLEEAGYACAVPTCRATTTEIAHIEPYAKVQEHTFANLIALCPNCHTRFDQKKEIPKLSILRYKANLAVLNGRYSDLERRMLEAAAETPGNTIFPIHRSVALLVRHLVADGIFARLRDHGLGGLSMNGQEVEQYYAITPKGREFVRRWQEADPLLD
ncbi:HNH endonuclease signature motif containing protein [Streptomyces sp. CC208A]|uniref:HNH endonuclease signature motif containing protein n=1 Tax=Streptomyces sp. CC208A TaxID=3044573 RepID=UPI0024A93E8A|nr:HNH endonuclease signature motif containing protein [Streptomyces sp. CC208A]